MKYRIEDLILLNMAGIGYIRLKKIMEHFSGNLRKAINSTFKEWRKIEGIEHSFIDRIFELRTNKELTSEVALLKKKNVTVLSIFDEAYPENLKNIYNPPIVLYVKGDILPQDRIAIAIVGSRKATPYGINICEKISGSLAELGITVVSGMARGIDSAAHKGALKRRGRTLAVLGCGLSNIYPPENRRLSEEIAVSGALISEFPMKTPPYARNFPIRNRIISGLSLGVVVVEATKNSGALITARYGLEEGREIFAIPGKVGVATSEGTHRLIKNGARLIETADEIIDELNLSVLAEKPVKKNIDAGSDNLEGKNKEDKHNSLGYLEKKIYDILSDEPEHIEDIIDKSELSSQLVANLLVGLELKGMVRGLPGKRFVAI